jgi:hypothetical protein
MNMDVPAGVALEDLNRPAFLAKAPFWFGANLQATIPVSFD